MDRSLSTTPRAYSLLGQGEVRLASASHSHRLRLILGALVPHGYGVTAVGNVFDLVAPAVARLREIRSWADDDISRHVGVDIAEQRHDPGFIECEGTLLAFWPCPKIVRGFLVASDGRPEDVVRDIVAIKKLNGCALLHGDNVRREQESLLIYYRMLFGSGKCFARDGIDVNYRVSLHAGDFALDIAGPRSNAQPADQRDRSESLHCELAVHCFLLLRNRCKPQLTCC